MPLSPGTSSCPRCGTVNLGSADDCSGCGRRLPRVQANLRPGDVIHDKYEVLALLGVGGMGEVYKVRHTTLDATRCIKMMKGNLLESEAMQARFVREARIATRIHHPNVALVHDFDTTEDGTHYLVTEFIDGITVRQWSRRHGRFAVELAVFLVRQVLSGLSQIHARGLLHRDISADNIMLTLGYDATPMAKIIDLGIAKVVEGPAELSGVTQAGVFIGNPRYASPDQLGALGEGETIDQRADLYCLGVVFYEMIVGAPPFTSSSAEGYVVRHLTESPRRFSEVAPDVEIPDGLEDVVFRALEKNRERRHGSASEFLRALDRLGHLEDLDLSRYAEEIAAELPSRQAEALLREVTPLPDEATSRPGRVPTVEDEPLSAVDTEIEMTPASEPPPSPPRLRTEEIGAPPARQPLATVSYQVSATQPPPARTRGSMWMIAVAGAILVIAFLVFVVRQSGGGRNEGAAPPVDTRRAPNLFIDSSPWAIVASVRSADGTQLIEGGGRPTPIALSAAPGDYTVTLVHDHDSRERLVRVGEESPSRIVESFGAVDVDDFFARMTRRGELDAPPLRTSAESSASGDEDVVASLRGQINDLSRRAERALDAIRNIPAPPANLVISRSRLDQAMLRASVASRVEDVGRLGTLATELEDALDTCERTLRAAEKAQLALPAQLVRATAMYFDRRYQDALDTLTGTTVEGDSSIALARLLSAASRFAIYRLDGERSNEIREAAAADVRACRNRDRVITPTKADFSPAFVEFFATEAKE